MAPAPYSTSMFPNRFTLRWTHEGILSLLSSSPAPPYSKRLTNTGLQVLVNNPAARNVIQGRNVTHEQDDGKTSYLLLPNDRGESSGTGPQAGFM